MKRIRDRVAGLDVHRDTMVACALVGDPDGMVGAERATFATTVRGVGELADWLAERGVSTVVMEATGVYWKPVYYPLEGLFDELWLVNAHHVKNVPGRKTDLSDAEWLADVAAHGMVRPSLVPPPPIRELRDLTRYRKTQVDARVREIQRLEGVLQDAGVKLSSVASKVLTKSGREMVEALIAGERDPVKLADLAKGRMRPKREALAEALAGRFGDHHRVLCRHILDHIDFLDSTITALDEEVAARLGPFEAAVRLLCSIPGVSRVTAEVIVAETGADMSRFPTPGHLCAWAGVAPASHESAGKRHPAGTRPGSRWLRRTLIEAARAAARTKDTYLAARYRHITRHRGPNKAAMAVAHSILAAAWHMLTTGEPYQDLGADHYTRHQNPQNRARQLTQQLEKLGYNVTLTTAA